MADNDLDLSFRPHYLEINKKSAAGGGRASARKRLDSGDEVEAFADLRATMQRGGGSKIAVPTVGGSYRKNIDDNSAIEFRGSKQREGNKDWEVGVTYEKRFKKGGLVSAPASEPKRSYPKKK